MSKGYWHSLTGECRWADKSGHRKGLTKGGALTYWIVQKDRQVRTQKESDQGHSLPEECQWTDKSGHRNNPIKGGAITS